MAELTTRIQLRNDSAENWAAAGDKVLLPGEVGLERHDSGKVKMKVGDGITTWADLDYFGGEEAKTFTVTSLDEISSDINLAVGDTAIVKTLILGTTDKYSYTGYVWNGTDWAAMDGNYNASNVYFDEDFTFTKEIGTVTIPESGSAVVNAQGKTVKEFLAGLFAAEQNPKTTQPTASITLSGSGAKEVGTVFTPSYTTRLTAGSYTYGPDTGIVANSWSVKDSNNVVKDTETGSFDSFTVEESTNYKLSATIGYADGTIPKTNIGNDYPAGQIKAGTRSATSKAVTGYRSWFYGYRTGENAFDIDTLTSDNIRSLTSSNGNFANSLNTSNMKQMFFAAPTGEVSNVEVSDATNGAPQTVKKTTVSVEGANGYVATEYDVFYVSNAVAGTGSATFNIVTTK